MAPTKIPEQCDICHKKIKLYQPWHSVVSTGHFCKGQSKEKIFCSDCFKAYEHFLIEHEVQENHKQNLLDMKGDF